MLRFVICIFCTMWLVTTSVRSDLDPGSIVGLWLLDEGKGDTAQDSSGNGLHGQFTGNSKWREGKIGDSVELGGNGNSIEIPGFAEDFPAEEVTLTAWVKVAGFRNQELFNLVPVEPGHIAVHMPWEDSMLWRFGTPFMEISAPIVDVRDRWHHWAFVHSVANNTMLIYQNGREVQNVPGSKAYTPRPGSFHIGGGPDFSFEGSVDEVGLFNTVLSQADIANVRENGLQPHIPAAVLPTSKLPILWGNIKSRKE